MNEIAKYNPQSTPAEIHRAMAKMPEVLAALDILDERIFRAGTARTFDEYSIADLLREIIPAIDSVLTDIQCRWPGEKKDFAIRVVDILKQYYGHLSVQDFRLAFELTITGELDAFFPKRADGSADRGHYQSFSTEYICKVLNAYKQRRAYALAAANKAMPTPPPERDAEREAEASRFVKMGLINAFEYFKEYGKLPGMSPVAEMLYHNELAGVGLAEKIEVTEAEQKEIFHRTLNAMARKGDIGDFNDLKKAGHTAESIQPGAYGIARRKALQTTFDKMLVKHIEITDYIKI